MFSAHISIFVNAPINSGGTNIPPATEADKISRFTFIETNILDPNSRYFIYFGETNVSVASEADKISYSRDQFTGYFRYADS